MTDHVPKGKIYGRQHILDFPQMQDESGLARNHDLIAIRCILDTQVMFMPCLVVLRQALETH